MGLILAFPGKNEGPKVGSLPEAPRMSWCQVLGSWLGPNLAPRSTCPPRGPEEAGRRQALCPARAGKVQGRAKMSAGAQTARLQQGETVTHGFIGEARAQPGTEHNGSRSFGGFGDGAPTQPSRGISEAPTRASQADLEPAKSPHTARTRTITAAVTRDRVHRIKATLRAPPGLHSSQGSRHSPR